MRTSKLSPHRCGFTLLEILIASALLLVLAGALLPPALSSYITRQQIQKEDAALAEIKKTIESSFDEAALANLNVSAITGEIDAGTQPTVFSTSTSPAYGSITGREWFAKVAAMRGLTVTPGAAVSPSSQPAVYNVAYNGVGQPRFLFLDPTADSSKQRYLLASLISPNGDLVLPAYAATAAWFNALWDTPWERTDISIPSLWGTLLSAAQQARWNSDTPGRSRTPRLRYVQIVQRKYPVIINANHPTDGVWVTWNNGQYAQVPITAGSGANTLGPILAGRLLDIAVGDTYANSKHSKLTVRENSQFTAQ